MSSSAWYTAYGQITIAVRERCTRSSSEKFGQDSFEPMKVAIAKRSPKMKYPRARVIRNRNIRYSPLKSDSVE